MELSFLIKKNKIAMKNKSKDLLNSLIEETLDDGKAMNIVSISLSGKSSIADYMIIASGTSARHVSSLAEQVSKKLKDSNFTVFSIQGKEESNWVLVDAGDTIVHIFRPEVRDFYNLDKMWLTPQESLTI